MPSVLSDLARVMSEDESRMTFPRIYSPSRAAPGYPLSNCLFDLLSDYQNNIILVFKRIVFFYMIVS